jgi:hypothetical protein
LNSVLNKPWYWLAMLDGMTGVWHWIVVVVEFKIVHGNPPTLTTNGYVVLVSKKLPTMSNIVPPAVLPELGVTLEITK